MGIGKDLSRWSIVVGWLWGFRGTADGGGEENGVRGESVETDEAEDEEQEQEESDDEDVRVWWVK